MDPREIRGQLVDEAKECLALVAAGYPMHEISREMELLSRLFQGIAICHLLDTLDTEEFRTNLLRSVHARIYFLRKSKEQGNLGDRRRALSRTEALFDVLVVGHRGLLKELAQHSALPWDGCWEYEDDHLYFLIVEQLALGADQTAVESLIARYLRALDKRPDARFKVVHALARRDDADLSAALNLLMQECDDAQQARQAMLLEPDLEAYLHWPRCFVSIEGLALIALARVLGMAAPETPALCPTAGQLPASDLEPEDFFVGIERVLSARTA